jgi:threonine dehydrogenase-like Zn-dependent dehydrogenase
MFGAVDHAIKRDSNALEKIHELTSGKGYEASIDCSGAGAARAVALKGTRQWGRCAFVGEGGDVHFDVSPHLIHPQITIYGSWVTSLGHMSQLAERLSRWNLHPDKTVTHTFKLEQASEAYRVAAEGQSGKVAIVFD